MVPAILQGAGRATRRVHPLLWLVLGASAALGASTVVLFRATPFARQPVLDERSYVDWARAIVEGPVWGREVFYQDPF